MITYERLWKQMKKKGISQYRLKAEGISNSTLTRLKHNEAISTETLNKLCKILECRVEDVIQFVEENDK